MALIQLFATDGSATVDLDNPEAFKQGNGTKTNYDGWSPVVAPLNEGVIGPRLKPVIEELTLTMKAPDSVVLFQRIDAIRQMLAQARAWSKQRRGTPPVLFQYRATGSTTLTSAIVLGPPEGEIGIEYGAPYADAGMFGHLRDVKIRFWREGEWIGEGEISATSAAYSSGIEGSVTFPTSIVEGRLDLRFGLSNLVSTGANKQVSMPEAIILVAPSLGDIGVISAGSLTGTGFTGAASQRSGQTLTYTPTNTNEQTASADITGLLSAGLYDVFSVVTVTGTFSVQLEAGLNPAAFSVQPRKATRRSILANTGKRFTYPVSLGTIDLPWAPERLYLKIKADAASGSALFDTLVFFRRSQYSHVIQTTESDGLGGVIGGIEIGHPPINHERYQIIDGLSTVPGGYLSDIRLTTTGTTVAALILSGSGTPSQTTYIPSTGSGPASVTLRATRTPTYHMPR